MAVTDTLNIAKDSLELFKNAYYAQINTGSFWNELYSWSSLIGFLCEIVGGVFFLYVLFWFFSPKIKISKFIAYNNSRAGHYNYFFKIVNKSYFFKLVDVKMDLYKATPINNGLDIKLENIKLQKSEMPYIDSILSGNGKQKTFACQFLTDETQDIDLKTFLTSENSSHISVVFSCTHILSSIRKKFVYNYHFNDIIDGVFESGNNLNVRKK